MIAIRVVAIPSEVAAQVRTSKKAPHYGHPAHTEVAGGYGPCRHCLRTFRVGEEQRTLFTYDPFDQIEQVPLPGPIFIHTEVCERYPENAGYPDDLRKHAAVQCGNRSIRLPCFHRLCEGPASHCPASCRCRRSRRCGRRTAAAPRGRLHRSPRPARQAKSL
jgi:hypothetical protein